MRLKTRSKVLLPQPEGPMIAVTRFSHVEGDVVQGLRLSVEEGESFDLELDRADPFNRAEVRLGRLHFGPVEDAGVPHPPRR